MFSPSLNNQGLLEEKIPVGISQCLLGENVRFDGGHKKSRLCINQLGKYFEYKSSCPEIGAGLGVPRQTLRLIGDSDNQKVVETKDNTIDVTDALSEYSQRRVNQLGDLSGYIFMQKSPSCGVFRVKVYADNGYAQNSSMGIFASTFTNAHPLIPIEEEGRLHDPVLLENFLIRVVIYHHWKTKVLPSITSKTLIDFHQRIKYQMMAHSLEGYKLTGKLLSDLRSRPLETIANEYITLVMHHLQKKANRKTHTNALLHMRGYFKGKLSKLEQQELGQMIEDYRLGIIPLIVPITLIQHYTRTIGSEYIEQQLYLQPYPHDLGLRNQI
jgi:uncharacterized protein YbgA (DUF1722 family)/uncharacterized protein YbbK (DUF523 family)